MPPPARGFELWPAREGIAWAYFRLRSQSPSTLDLPALQSLDALIGEVERGVRTGEIQALVIASGTLDRSLAGYAPAEVAALDEEGVVAWSHEAQGILSRLEALPVPTVAAIQGDWSGAAAEIALACRYRVAAGGGGNRIVYSHLTEGLPPAWGGTVRLPRIVGMPVAARLILTGESLDAPRAKSLGVVDRIFPADDFEEAVERFAKRRIARAPGNRGVERRPIHERLLHEKASGRRLTARRVIRRYRALARTDPAVKATLELLFEASSVPAQRALALESAAAGRVSLEPSTRARLHAGRVLQEVRRLPAGNASAISAAVIGAGQTGSDLAHLLIAAGISVRLKDTFATVRSGLAQTRRRIRWEQHQGRISSVQARRRAGRLDGVTGFGGFGTLDLLIAAPDGTAADPVSLLRGAEPHVLPECVLAIHDWTRSPTAAQRELRYAERVLGIVCHFPTDVFPLVEVIPGADTSSSTVERTLSFLADTGLTPVVVLDDPPTPGLRLTGIYLAEACRLLAEGATVFQVDEAMEAFGFQVGPFHRLDAIGSVRAHRILTALSEALGERFRTTAILDRIARDTQTFYRYRNGVPVAPNASLPEGLSPGGPTVTEMIQRRILLLLANEAAHILQAHPRLHPPTLDAISLIGLGFPRDRGGLVHHVETVGPVTLVEELDRVARRAGPTYEPAALLREAVSSGRSNLRMSPDRADAPAVAGNGTEAGPGMDGNGDAGKSRTVEGRDATRCGRLRAITGRMTRPRLDSGGRER